MAHGDGNYFADDATLDRLEGENLVALRYATKAGEVTPEANLNGSARSIAGILSPNLRVLGPDAAPGGPGRPADGRHRRQAAVRRARGRVDGAHAWTREINESLARELRPQRRGIRPRPRHHGPHADADRTRRVQRHVVGALQLQIVPRLAEAVADQGTLGHPRAGRERRRGRYRRRAGRRSSRWRATTTRASSSPTRVRRPASAAFCAMSSPWARGRSPT